MPVLDPVIPPLAESVLPPVKPDIGEWAEEHIRFDTAVDAAPRFILAKSPYARFVFSAWNDPKVEEVFLLWPTQAGKTTCMSVILCNIIANDPGPVIFVQADETPTKAFVKFRLKPTVRMTFPGMLKDSARAEDWTDNYGTFIGGTHLWPAWATSESRCRSWPRRYVIGDETSLWKLPRRFILERTKQFPRNRKALWGTTPTEEDEASWIDATQVFRLHRWYVACPGCGAMQTLEFKNLRFGHCKEDGTWNLDRVERETFYECAHCNRAITEKERARVLAHGEARTETPERSLRKVSLRITSLDVPGIPWGLTARNWLESKDNPENLRAFVNGWLVEPWRPMTESVEKSALLKRISGIKSLSAPENTVALLGGVDVQRGHVWVTVRAILKDRRSALILARRVDGDGSTRRALERCWEETLSASYPVMNATDPMSVLFAAVDSGDGTTTDEVYDFCLAHRNVFPIKGSGRMSNNWRMTIIDRFSDGRAIVGGLQLYLLNTEFWREQVHGRYSRPVDEPGSWLICDDAPAEYFDHMLAWGVMTKKTPRGMVKEWVQKSKADHLLDCEIYCAALADILGERFLPKSTAKRPRKYGVIGRAFE